MSFVLHLDGMEKRHDTFAGLKGVFNTVVSAIKAAKREGFRVLINSTIYKGTDLSELSQLFKLLIALEVDGVMVSPAFSYEAVGNDVFLSRSDISEVFRSIFDLGYDVPYYNSPIYLEFLAGRRNLPCSPWSTPTRNPVGWKRPCYLITDDHCATFNELMEETQWENYGVGNDGRCANCMVHCGFEASALSHGGGGVKDVLRPACWAVSLS
jgi:hopanoid biosynthesis associated radical SAM protein HpnH